MQLEVEQKAVVTTCSSTAW